MTSDLLTFYVDLVKQYDIGERRDRWPVPAESELVWICYRNAETPEHKGHYYEADREEDRSGRIMIYRQGLNDRDGPRGAKMAALATDPMEELLSFAHEMGHHRSWLARTFCDFDEDSPRETFAEECRAWMHGRRFLDAHGFTQWDAFGHREKAGLLGYEEGLKLTAEATAEIRQAIADEIGKLAARWYLDPWTSEEANE